MIEMLQRRASDTHTDRTRCLERQREVEIPELARGTVQPSVFIAPYFYINRILFYLVLKPIIYALNNYIYTIRNEIDYRNNLSKFRKTLRLQYFLCYKITRSYQVRTAKIDGLKQSRQLSKSFIS